MVVHAPGEMAQYVPLAQSAGTPMRHLTWEGSGDGWLSASTNDECVDVTSVTSMIESATSRAASSVEAMKDLTVPRRLTIFNPHTTAMLMATNSIKNAGVMVD
jgi:hypothetical protein